MNWNQGAEQFLNALSSADPTPGGGAAAAMAGAMGCALVLMAIGTTHKRPNLPQDFLPTLQSTQQKMSQWHKELKKLMQQDAQAYDSYIAARRLPLADSTRLEALQNALWFAATVPSDIATVCTHALREVNVVEPFIAPIILSDVHCAKHLLKSAIACSLENMRVNLKGITDEQRIKELQQKLTSFEKVL